MLFSFVKKDGNVLRVGDIDEASVLAKIDSYVAAGYERAEAEEWDAQILKGEPAAATEVAPEEVVAPEAAAEAPAEGAPEVG